jgi:hypothetical protein
MDVRLPDGTVLQNVPDGTTKAQLTEKLRNNGYDVSKLQSAPSAPIDPTEGNSFLDNAIIGAGKSFVDTYEGVKQLGAEVGNKVGLVSDETVAGIQQNVDERAQLDKPLMNTGGGVVGNIAGQVAQIAVPGSILGKGAAVNTARNSLMPYVASAAEGAAFAGAQPVLTGQSRGENATIGAVGGAVGTGIAKGIGKIAAPSSKVSSEVANLANRAKELGIDVRADQVVNSKPLNVISSALDYVPFSGAASSKALQQKQFNTAVARTIGENTDNLTQALKTADSRLSGEFDTVLKSTAVKADSNFIDDLVRVQADARNEMTDAQYGVLKRQVDNVLGKIKDGDLIDADAAYNIKKGLDRIGKSNDTTLAFYAKEMRSALMDALNRSLPDGGESFAKTRQQYGNLRELEKLVPRGAEADISAARLANARGIRSKDLSELADIASQFLKGRVGDSGTAQRAGVYGMWGAGTMIDPVSAGIGLTAGRVANSALGSNRLTNYMINGAPALQSNIPNQLLPAAGTALAISNQ